MKFFSGKPLSGNVLAYVLSFLCMFVLFQTLCFSNTDSKPEEKEIVAGTVNGNNILKSELDLGVAAYKQKAGKESVTTDEKTELLKNMIRRVLILSQPEVQANRKDPRIEKRVLEFENTLIIRKYLRDNAYALVQVTEEQMLDYYEKNKKKEFSIPEKLEARHILMRDEETALIVLIKLQSGEDFGQLAYKYSMDLPRALEGGSMGLIPKGKTYPALEENLFSLKAGEYSNIVKTPYGYHILTVDKVHPRTYTPFEEVKEKIKQRLMYKNQENAFHKMAADLEKTASIHIFYENL